VAAVVADSESFREMMTLALLFLATCFLAYSNGANDNFKGVASLFGSRTSSYRTAISWATVTTFAGSIMSIFLAQTLLKKFSGKGIVPEHFVGSEHFLLAVATGAGLTVITATLSNFNDPRTDWRDHWLRCCRGRLRNKSRRVGKRFRSATTAQSGSRDRSCRDSVHPASCHSNRNRRD